ncbi:MAG: S1 RNA-binding domain-containing protein [Candidatus Buchananbacteria bacterium]|nr:S1 RNA-binding domain-containing protein [Candidatus Buchananbacteria bacterium]
MPIKEKKDSIMGKLLDEKQYFNFPKVGDLIKGKVISANKNEVYLDLGGVATGVVRGRERYDEAEEYKNLKAGDEIEATVLEIENENGELELSFQYAGRQKAWLLIKEHEKKGVIVSVTVLDANKGGLMVRVENTMGFLPVSQLSPEHYPRVPGGDKNRIFEILKSYVGQKFEVKVLDAKEDEDKLIVSEKAAWEETQKDVLGKYQVGTVVEGTVTAITDFGVFVEFSDKLEGLIHISEIAWQRIDNPNDYVKVGQKVKAEIIGIQGTKIFLSMKKLLADPWHDVETKYTIGQKVSGKVIKINPFGLFVELDENIHGLAHVSQLSDKPVEDLNTLANIGETKDFFIVSMDPKNHRLGLSLTKPKPKKEKAEKKAETDLPATAEEKPAKAVKKEKKEKADSMFNNDVVNDIVEEVTEAPEVVE